MSRFTLILFIAVALFGCSSETRVVQVEEPDYYPNCHYVEKTEAFQTCLEQNEGRIFNEWIYYCPQDSDDCKDVWIEDDDKWTYCEVTLSQKKCSEL